MRVVVRPAERRSGAAGHGSGGTRPAGRRLAVSEAARRARPDTGGGAGTIGNGRRPGAQRERRRPANGSRSPNGGFWNDTTGNRIEAHGAGLIHVGDTWYWIGEDKSHNAGTFKGVNCYASKDLASWQFRNAIITRATSTELAASDRIIERPKVIYNDTTKKFVMWLHWDGPSYATAEARASSPARPSTATTR